MVRELKKDEWLRYKELRLDSLIESPYAFGSTHEAESTRTDADWEKRLIEGVDSNTDIPLIAIHEENSAGMAWGKIEIDEPEIANLYQMWVHPGFRGKGIGFALLTKFKEWAMKSGALSLHLDVTVDNGNAYQLYHSFGFINSGPLEPLRKDSCLKMQPMFLMLKNA